jgi:A/G-specific adenine glycosylase
MTDFTILIQDWYRLNKRDLPWRTTKSPYFIWLSEIIMQQTQVIQGLAYYNKFVSTYPTINELANAKEDEVLNLWQGLGYYSRARNLHFTAKQIVEQNNSKFPANYNDLLKLKGVGEYTAAAIASFAYNQCHAVVDGNVFRVLSRVFNIDTPINSTQGKKEFYTLANSLIDETSPGIHNQAIMELGALVCKPKNPKCDICPVAEICISREKSTMLDLPVKLKKVKVKQRYLNYLIETDGVYVEIIKRNENDIWKGLYNFKLLESNDSLDSLDTYNLDLKMFHILTHQKLEISFWVKKVKSIKNFTQGEVVEIQRINDYPFPQAIIKYFKKSSYLNIK